MPKIVTFKYISMYKFLDDEINEIMTRNLTNT